MKKCTRATRPSGRQTLPFPAMNDHVDLWNSLTEQQQQDCRQALRQILVAVARQARNTAHDDRELLVYNPE